jgi:hypothetical protein
VRGVLINSKHNILSVPQRPENNRGVFIYRIIIYKNLKELTMMKRISPDTPTYAVPPKTLIPVSDHLTQLTTIPPSRMFLIKKSLAVYKEKNPNSPTYDASQGDGGASLPGTPVEILERAAQMQVENGTAYGMPFGTNDFRRSVVEEAQELVRSILSELLEDAML